MNCAQRPCDCPPSSSVIVGCKPSSGILRGKIYAPAYISAYQIAVDHGFEGTEEEWLESLKGEDGKSAYEIAVEHGYVGSIEDWLRSLQGEDGKSAYQIAVEHGYTGTEDEWIQEVEGNRVLIEAVQQQVTDVASTVNVLQTTLDKYGSKLEPIFEAEEANPGVIYNVVMTPEKPEDAGDDVSELDKPELQRLTASEINAICSS